MTTETRINRKDLIINTSAELFAQHGYTATSVRQISEQVGCTEAALYYHFKDGKRALLQEVITRRAPKVELLFDLCDESQSLQDLMLCFSKHLLDGQILEQIRESQWIFSEFPRLNKEEQAIIHNKFTDGNCGLRNILQRFIDDERKVEEVSWTMMCALFGYIHVFHTLRLTDVISFSIEDLSRNLVKIFD